MIDTYVHVGDNRNFELKWTINGYGDGQSTFATLHYPIPAEDGGAPYCGPRQELPMEFLTRLAQDLFDSVLLAPEILPESVLCRTHDRIVWWTPAQQRVMYFKDQRDGLEYSLINAKRYPHPALVWKIQENGLSVRALSENKRPSADTPLHPVPYWNTYADGAICVGSMPTPERACVETLRGFEDGFWNSNFTHPNCMKSVTTHPRGFFALWHELIDAESFPVEYLLPPLETLSEFVQRAYRQKFDLPEAEPTATPEPLAA